MPSAGSNDVPRSLPLLLARRHVGYLGIPHRSPAGNQSPRAFVDGVAKQFSPHCLVQSPQFVTPQTQGNARSAIAINSIHVDRMENRFLLAGGNDAIVSVYDISKWGSEEYLERYGKGGTSKISSGASSRSNKARTQHKPIASSQREPPRALFTSVEGSNNLHAAIEIPGGHASPISKVQWYPVDSGAFLSTSKDGCLLVWDTDSMAPVSQSLPFAETKGGIATFHLSPLRNYSAVVASLQDPSLKLVDIRSSASSHTLLGHGGPGVSSVQWAPQNDVILASGGLDGTVRLWDIRKAGGRSCLAILDQDRSQPPSRTRPYQADYSHLPKPSAGLPVNFAGDEHAGSFRGSHKKHSSARQLPSVSSTELAPNNYRMTENSTVSSHGAPVSALSFLKDNGGHHLVSASRDGQLHVWDLRANGHLLPLRFLAPGQQPAISKKRVQTPLLLTSFGKSDNAASSPGACWVGNGTALFGYSLDRGGVPQKVLQGHLHVITAIDVIEGNMQLVTAGKDGMILAWGKPDQGQENYLKRKVDQDSW
ncbi:excision repair protein ERCC-8 [Seminavis robusta]|uniref:Excision repair protein ERCC-8 n=1 Tax=Seminavis robusta TaxID=568900 RepID=A0A9N8HFL7_9STRA|nr:excision repair protein ERCC-8 [Seminavis robusta]|eukprot:Sro355_g125000.1 excision repair protein ERCC-8 (537) ;mRNA; r:18991-20601